MSHVNYPQEESIVDQVFSILKTDSGTEFGIGAICHLEDKVQVNNIITMIL